MCLGNFQLASAQVLLVPLQMRLDISKLLQQIVVLQDLDVLDVVVCLFVTFELLIGRAWVDSFKDAKLAEVLQAELQSSNRI